jgi:hypothetical protein
MSRTEKPGMTASVFLSESSSLLLQQPPKIDDMVKTSTASI